MINIVIPMAGLGSRFITAGYTKPKPFIDVAGKTMIERVLESLVYKDASYFLIAREEHLEEERALVQRIIESYHVTFVPISNLTEGTVCTVLFAREYINNDRPLMIANCDQIIELDIADFINDASKRSLDGSIMTFFDNKMDPKWSFARVNDSGNVLEVREKVAISNYATVGIYLFSTGSSFVNAAIDMIINNDRVNNEFYTCPTYNYLINENANIGHYLIDKDLMHGIGTPEDLNKYINAITH